MLSVHQLFVIEKSGYRYDKTDRNIGIVLAKFKPDLMECGTDVVLNGLFRHRKADCNFFYR